MKWSLNTDGTNTINIIKANNNLSPQLTERKTNTTKYAVGSQGHSLGKAQTCSWFPFNHDFLSVNSVNMIDNSLTKTYTPGVNTGAYEM